LATEVFVGDPARFPDGKALASYVGMIPSEHSSGRRQRLGALSKQGNPFLRFLWCGARGTALSRSAEPNALWCADYKGEFMLGVHRYCYPLTITEFASRLLTCEALSTTREKRSSSGRSRNSACRRRPDRQRRAVRSQVLRARGDSSKIALTKGRMFNSAIHGRGTPGHLSTDHVRCSTRTGGQRTFGFWR